MLQIQQLDKVIEQRTVLSIDALDIAAGEVLAIIGPVGSGKSLLIRLLCGEVIPSRGSVVLDGRDVHREPVVRTRIGVLFDDDLLYKRHTALGNLEFYGHMRGLPISHASAALALVGLGDQMRERVFRLARTAQRRLAFARALMGQPPLLLLDRPTLRTDQDAQALFARLIVAAAGAGAAVILTEEDLSWAGRCCTRVVELESGRVTGAYQQAADPSPSAPERHIPFKVPARRDDRIVLYDPGDILFATSRDGKTFLRTASEEAATNLTLQELETRLAGRGFFKAHRAYLVNLQHIKAVIQFTRNSYTLQLNDGHDTMIPLSKQSEKELQELLGY